MHARHQLELLPRLGRDPRGERVNETLRSVKSIHLFTSIWECDPMDLCGSLWIYVDICVDFGKLAHFLTRHIHIYIDIHI